MDVIKEMEEKIKEKGKGEKKEREGDISFLRCVYIHYLFWFIKGREGKFVYFYIYVFLYFDNFLPLFYEIILWIYLSFFFFFSNFMFGYTIDHYIYLI